MTPDVVERGKARGLTPHQILTLASIVEETGAGKERPIISAVFHNRISAGMEAPDGPYGHLRRPGF